MSAKEQDDKRVALHFVIPDEKSKETCHVYLREAFQASIDSELSPDWIAEKECLKLCPGKQDVFVLETFNCPAFTHLREFNCVLVGPRCLLSCLASDESLPLVAHPTFTAAMRGLHVAASGGGLSVKDELKEKIQLMAGVFTTRLFDNTTHLVVDTVCSNKYEKAFMKGVKVYTRKWVEAVWSEGQAENIHATDSRYDKYKCPPFLGVNICTSNLSRANIALVKDYVTKYGGKFNSIYSGTETGILVVGGSSGEKFKAAKSDGKPCVSLKWILESVKEGHALPTQDFEVDGTMASSPFKGNTAAVKFSEDSNISAIPFGNNTHIDATVMDSTVSSVATFCPGSVTPRAETPKKTSKITLHTTPVKGLGLCNPIDSKHLLHQLDLGKAKHAGSFLDGCGVYLYGWNGDEEDKLKRILKCSGAARFVELSDRTSHVLVGSMDKSLTRSLNTLTNKPHVVTIKWLLDSISQKKPVPEDLYTCFSFVKSVEAPSPLSKKGMAILQQSMIPPTNVNPPEVPKTKDLVGSNKESNVLLKKYQGADSSYESDLSLVCLKPVGKKCDSASAMPPPPAPVTLNKEESVAQPTLSNSNLTESQFEMIFQGLTFDLSSLDEESAVDVKTQFILPYGGDIASQSSKEMPHYAVVPLIYSTVNQGASKVVTILWLEDCIINQDICEIEYYHQPVNVDVNKRPLQKCVLGFSGYSRQCQKKFIHKLAQILGAVTQEVFARVDRPSVKASTHLICQTIEGSQKYSAAVKWKLPAVSHEWLLACASSGRYVSENPFLLNKDVILQNDGSSVCHMPKVPQVSSLQSESRPSTPLRHDPKKIKDMLQKPLPENPFKIKTPELPMGFTQNPSPQRRKDYARWIKSFPSLKPQEPEVLKKDSPTLNEVRRNLLLTAGARIMESKRSKEVQCQEKDAHVTTSCSPEQAKAVDDDKSHVSPLDGQIDKLKELIEAPSNGADCPQPVKRNLVQHFPGRPSGTPGPFASGASQPYAIGWLDPVDVDRVCENKEKEYPLKESKESIDPSSTKRRSSEKESVGPANEVISNKKRKSSESAEGAPLDKKSCFQGEVNQKEITKKPEKVFLISHVENESEKTALIDGIRKLNGTYISSSEFDPSATHLLLPRPSRCEKLLSAIAAGIWVLHPSFVIDSVKNGEFQEEDAYEFGNPHAKHLDKLLESDLENRLSRAAYRWRISLVRSGLQGAFTGKRFIIKTTAQKAPALIRIVKSGNGKVVDEKDAVMGDICCYDKGPIDFKSFAKQRIVCVPATYLCDFLKDDPPPSPKHKAIREYVAACEKLGIGF